MDSELQRMESILTELLYLSKPRERIYEETSIVRVVNEVIELMMPNAIVNTVSLHLGCLSLWHWQGAGSDKNGVVR